MKPFAPDEATPSRAGVPGVSSHDRRGAEPSVASMPLRRRCVGCRALRRFRFPDRCPRACGGREASPSHHRSRGDGRWPCRNVLRAMADVRSVVARVDRGSHNGTRRSQASGRRRTRRAEAKRQRTCPAEAEAEDSCSPKPEGRGLVPSKREAEDTSRRSRVRRRRMACVAEQRWDRDEWDVTLADGGTYRIFRERSVDRWFVEGMSIRPSSALTRLTCLSALPCVHRAPRRVGFQLSAGRVAARNTRRARGRAWISRAGAARCRWRVRRAAVSQGGEARRAEGDHRRGADDRSIGCHLAPSHRHAGLKLGLPHTATPRIALRDHRPIWRLPVLVASAEGYRNLCRLITRMKMRAPKGEGALALEELEGSTAGLVALAGRALLDAGITAWAACSIGSSACSAAIRCSSSCSGICCETRKPTTWR